MRYHFFYKERVFLKLKAKFLLAATMTMMWRAAAFAADAAAAPSCGGFGFGGGGGGDGGGAAAGAAAGAEGSGMMGMLLPLAIFVLIFYFFIIRPQKKRQKMQDNLISSIAKGDQVVTIGGFFGTVQEVRDDSLMIELAQGVRVKILKSAVSTKRVNQAAPAAVADKLEA